MEQVGISIILDESFMSITMDMVMICVKGIKRMERSLRRMRSDLSTLTIRI